MKRSILLGIFTLLFFTSDLVYAKEIEYPNVRYSSQSNIIIKRVQTFDTQTVVDFTYKSNENVERYIFLSPPKSDNAMYIRINNFRYKLLYTIRIGNRDGITKCNPGQEITFTAVFEAIPRNASSFDLIEGKIGRWNFYGIQLDKEESNQIELCHLKIFRSYENEQDVTMNGDSKAFLMLYLDKGELCLANVCPSYDSQSWGYLIVEDSKKVKIDNENASTFYYAKWYYQNSYDDKSGIALVAIGQQGYTDKAIVQISVDEYVWSYVTNVKGNLEKILYDNYNKNNTSKPNKSNSIGKRKQRTLQKNPNFKIE